MRLVNPHPQIYLVLGDSATELAPPFMRVQEFFESPSKRFRRKFFTVEAFKAWYCRTQSVTGRFTYATDYGGYNVPGDVFNAWAATYAGRETEAEQSLLTLLGPVPSDFYVIGAPAQEAGTIDHELSHAFFHLFPEYRATMLGMFHGYNLRHVRRFLRSWMYAEDVLDDELIAYVMFDDAMLHRAGVSTKGLRGLRGGMRGVFQAYKERHIIL